MATPRLLIQGGKPTPEAVQFPEVLDLYACLKDGASHTFFTSGTTGTPKPIVFSAAQMTRSAQWSIQALSLPLGYVGLLALPLQFVAGKMMVVRAFIAQADLWYVAPTLRPFSLSLPHLDFVALTPAQVQATLGFSEDLNRLREVKVVLVGGGVLSPLAESTLQEFPHQVFHSYGMTETLTHCALRNIAPQRSRVFQPHHPSITFKEEDGLLSINYPFLTNGFLPTNDVVKVDNGGFIFLGRRDDVINLGGLKLHPAELEAKLPHELFKNRAWFIAGKEHNTWGQVPWLWIEGCEDLNIDSAELQAYLFGKEKMYGFALVPKFSRTSSGKIQKKATMASYVCKEVSFA
jgi:O-succinylbenzoic acid--CoA ligase